MGSTASSLLQRNPEKPVDYTVHGLVYWQGKYTPERLWHTILPDYKPPEGSSNTGGTVNSTGIPLVKYPENGNENESPEQEKKFNFSSMKQNFNFAGIKKIVQTKRNNNVTFCDKIEEDITESDVLSPSRNVLSSYSVTPNCVQPGSITFCKIEDTDNDYEASIEETTSNFKSLELLTSQKNTADNNELKYDNSKNHDRIIKTCFTENNEITVHDSVNSMCSSTSTKHCNYCDKSSYLSQPVPFINKDIITSEQFNVDSNIDSSSKNGSHPLFSSASDHNTNSGRICNDEPQLNFSSGEIIGNCQKQKLDGILKDVNGNMTEPLLEDEWLNFTYPFENIALSGGGMKAYSYMGAIKAMEDAGVLPHIKRFAGASAGAMCAASLALGYTAQEICKCFYADLCHVLNDQTCACILFVHKLYSRYGIHPGRRLLYWYGRQIGAKTGGNPDLTFKEHYNQFGKELCIVVSNITKMTTEYCHYTTTPDLPIRDAVRMSMALPVVYEPVVRMVDGHLNYYIDGGTGDHFPIHCFDGPTVGPNLKEPVNEKTIGYYVLSEKDSEHVLWRNTFGKEIPNKPTYMPDTKLARGSLQDEIKRRKKFQKNFDEKRFMRQLEKFSRMSMETLGMKHYETHNKTQVDTSNILAYLVSNLELLINAQVVGKMKPKDEDRTVPINVGYMETQFYDLEPADREFMLKQGYASTKKFLQQYVAKAKASKQ